jgi:hypothetical protein
MLVVLYNIGRKIMHYVTLTTFVIFGNREISYRCSNKTSIEHYCPLAQKAANPTVLQQHTFVSYAA